MSNEPINAWILDPVISAVNFVAEEAKINGLLYRALVHIEGSRPLLELAARHLASTHNQKAIGAMQRLLNEAPIQEEWAAEIRASDYALLNGHSLVAIWGALETCVENTIVGILAKDSSAITLIAKTEIQLPADTLAPDEYEELCKLFRKAEDAVRVKHDVVQTQENLLQLFGLSAACPGQKDTLLMANSLRNALVHRGGIIDAKAVRQAPMLSPLIGKKCSISRELYMKCHKAVSECLVALVRSICNSKYVVINDSK